MLTMNGTDSFWSKNSLAMFCLRERVNASVTFERSSFPHFVHFSLNTDEIGMIRLPVGREWAVYSTEKCACGKDNWFRSELFLYANNPLDGTTDSCGSTQS